MLYRFVIAITYFYVRLRFRMRYEGLENIPAGGGYILCSNHRSYHDPVFLVHKIPRNVRFMAKEELFKNRIFGGLIRRLGAFPIARGKGDTAAIDKSVGILRGGGVLLMFPEGTRSKDGKPLRPRSGVSVLAARAGADVLCCSVDYSGKLGFRTPVTLRFHPLLTNKALGVSPDIPSTIKAATKLTMDTIISGLTLTGSGAA
jgi:1-acyl-sn-glycerol-3-phosphate acyltransferase